MPPYEQEKGRWYKFDFDKPIDRRGTTSIKWNCLDGFAPHDDMLPYWIADTDFATVPEVVEALKKRLEHPVFGYANPLPSTFEAIQGWWDRRHGWKPETEWMFITCGVVMGIYFALQAYTQPGDKVVTLTPVYDPFFAAVNNSGRTLVRCPLHHEDNYYTIDFAALEKAFQDGAKAIIFCNPHNPVSRVWSAQELEGVAGLCRKYGVWLLCDEVHADYGLTRRYTPMGKVAQGYDKLVIYTAPSKTFNLAGMVSACIMVPDKTAREGWLPEKCAEENKNGVPVILLGVFFVMGALPIVTGMDLTMPAAIACAVYVAVLFVYTQIRYKHVLSRRENAATK